MRRSAIVMNPPRIDPTFDDDNEPKLPHAVNLDAIEAEIATGNGESKPSDFAPITERLEQTGRLMGDGIRQAASATAKQITDACAEVLALAQQIVADGEEFKKSLEDVAEAHAQRIAKATADMQRLVQTMTAERKRFNGEETKP
jgi:hypothetical protein